MERREFLYEGKAKQLYATDDKDLVIVHYKDDATAGNGAKNGSIHNKGIMNNEITTLIFNMLEEHGIKTHFVKKLNEEVVRENALAEIEKHFTDAMTVAKASGIGIDELQEILKTLDEVGEVWKA